MMLGITTATLINGFVLGWSVAWPPGPVNAERKIFARPAWQATTQAITSLLMLFFAAKLLLTLANFVNRGKAVCSIRFCNQAPYLAQRRGRQAVP